MHRFARGLILGSLLVSVAGVALAGAKEDILDLIKEANGGPLPKAKLAEIRKNYEHGEIMGEIYKPRSKRGLGIGPIGRADGLEIKIMSLAKRQLTEEQLMKEADDLIKLGHINAAVAQITTLYVPSTKAGKGPKDWKESAEQLAKSSAELAKAAKAGNIKDVQKAANNMNNACNSCHADFRD